MLLTIAGVLLVLWVVGMVTAQTMGGYIHVFLVLAIMMALFRLIQGPRVKADPRERESRS